ncbi:MAG: LON peptidase substrate-binding domain-containing protein [Armatimonadota bacterium]
MTAISREIALLPVPAVLFPGTFLPVRIEESPDRALVMSSVKEEQQIGVVLSHVPHESSRPTVPCTTGCLASVALLLSDGEDEKPSMAVLYGEQRMRVLSFARQTPVLTGEIEALDDYTGMHAERRSKQAAELFRQYLDLVRQRYQMEVGGLSLPDDPIMASYMLAAVLQLPLETKQRWLESASAAFRLEEELTFLRGECDTHMTFLALSRHTHQAYFTPDFRLYSSLISEN